MSDPKPDNDALLRWMLDILDAPLPEDPIQFEVASDNVVRICRKLESMKAPCDFCGRPSTERDHGACHNVITQTATWGFTIL